MDKQNEGDFSILSLLAGICVLWFLVSLGFMTDATYEALAEWYKPKLDEPRDYLFLLICLTLCLTPVGWITSLFWVISEGGWGFWTVLGVYGIFIVIFMFLMLGIIMAIIGWTFEWLGVRHAIMSQKIRETREKTQD